MLRFGNLVERLNKNMCECGHHLFDADTIRNPRMVSEKTDSSDGKITLTKEIEAIQPCIRFRCKFSKKVRGYIMFLIWPDGPGYSHLPMDWHEIKDEQSNALSAKF